MSVAGKEVLEPGLTTLTLFLLTSRILLSRFPDPGACIQPRPLLEDPSTLQNGTG